MEIGDDIGGYSYYRSATVRCSSQTTKKGGNISEKEMLRSLHKVVNRFTNSSDPPMLVGVMGYLMCRFDISWTRFL